MQNTTDSGSRSPPQSGGVVTRAQTAALNDTAQPSLTSGFGTVIQKERDLQKATEGSLGRVTGERSTEIDRLLRHQHGRLGANIALLEERYEALPRPGRFQSWHDGGNPPATPPRTTKREGTDVLPDLIARHNGLLVDIEALIGCAHDGQRGELILTEVSRNHAEMAAKLAAVLKNDAPTAPTEQDGGSASRGTRQAQEIWDNEGGPPATHSPGGL